MKPTSSTPNAVLYGAFISLASELTRGIPRELRASLAGTIRGQCIAAMNMLALRAAGSQQAPDDIELLCRLRTLQTLAAAAHAQRMISDRAVRRLATVLDQVRNDISAAALDTAPAGREIRLAAAVAATAPPAAAGGQRP
jgi:hypothetical protein